MNGATSIDPARHNDPSDEIAAAVTYTISVAANFELQWQENGPAAIKSSPQPFAGFEVLEVGPGPTLGMAVLLACSGARVAVADRFCASWNPEFHPAFYLALRERVAWRGATYVAPIDRLLEADSFAPDVVRVHALAAEELWKIDERFDVVLSNAVLEHVQDIGVTAASLASITVPGGCGLHQVDLRDHRDFSRPLEYLTMSRHDYDALRQRNRCESGGQWRLSTIGAAFEAAGFSQSATPSMYAEDDYLADVRPRLHPDFSDLSDADLAAISALYVMRRHEIDMQNRAAD